MRPGSTCRWVPSRFFSHFIFILKLKLKGRTSKIISSNLRYSSKGNYSLQKREGIFVKIIACKIRNEQQLNCNSVTSSVEGGVIRAEIWLKNVFLLRYSEPDRNNVVTDEIEREDWLWFCGLIWSHDTFRYIQSGFHLSLELTNWRQFFMYMSCYWSWISS